MDRLITIAVITVAGNLFMLLQTHDDTEVDSLLIQQKSNIFLIPTISGFLLSIVSLFIEDKFFKKLETTMPFFQQLLVRWLIGSFFIIFVTILTYTVVISSIHNSISESFSNGIAFIESTTFLLLYIFLIISAFFLHFIKQLGNWFGYNILLNYFLGKYNVPAEQERIFMFIDLKDSTGIAERLGHIKYSRFINKCYVDLQVFLDKYAAEVYQYVGDEVVLTWLKDDLTEKSDPFKLFFDYQSFLGQSVEDYVIKFGVVPKFKCCIHSGRVVVTKVGGRFKSMAYHGDVLNSSARMLELCNKYGKDLLAAESMIEPAEISNPFKITYIDAVLLRGKHQRLKVYSVEKV